MLVRLTPIPMMEAQAFEAAIRAGGRKPEAFSAQMFETVSGARMRRVHVITQGAAAQYDATDPGWTDNFARHLARGFFG